MLFLVKIRICNFIKITLLFYRTLEVLVKIPGNEKCCDCKTPNPNWASINLGITLCIG